jgi:hypothetical protein
MSGPRCLTKRELRKLEQERKGCLIRVPGECMNQGDGCKNCCFPIDTESKRRRMDDLK